MAAPKTPVTPLTPQQEAFAQAVARGMNFAAAYRATYNVTPQTSPAGISTDAHKLANKPKVAARIEELRRRQERAVQAAGDISAEERYRTYAELAKMALEKGDVSTAVRAQDSITKIAGLFSENRKNDRDPLTELPRDVRDALAALAKAKAEQVH